MAPGQLALRGLAVRRGNEQFVGPETSVSGAAHRHLQRIEHRLIEPLAGGQIAHDQLDVIDQAATMDFIGLHDVSCWGLV
ncbi:hypothetical protein D3C72_2127790 [compost metagenome]